MRDGRTLTRLGMGRQTIHYPRTHETRKEEYSQVNYISRYTFTHRSSKKQSFASIFESPNDEKIVRQQRFVYAQHELIW